MLGLLIAPAAWTGSEDARHLPDDRAQAELPTSVLPFSLAEFFARYYDRTMLRLNHTQTHFDPEAVWARADFAANLAAIVDDGKARTPGVVKPYAGKGKEKYPLAILTPTLTLTLALTSRPAPPHPDQARRGLGLSVLEPARPAAVQGALPRGR